MSDLEKHWIRLLIDIFRKHATLPDMFPIVGIITAAVVVARCLMNTKLVPPLKSVFTDGHNPYALVLFLLVVLLAIVYLSAAWIELRWAREHWKELIPTPDVSSLPISVLIFCTLMLMLFLTPNIKWFSLAYLIYAVLDSLGCSLYLATINTSLKKAIQTIQSSRPRYQTKAFDAVVTFYQRRWWMKLHFAKFLAAITSASLAWLYPNPAYAYVLSISIIALNEVVVWSWRYHLYKAHGFLRLALPHDA